MTSLDPRAQIATHGFALLPDFYAPEDLAPATAEIDALDCPPSPRSHGGIYAVRYLLQLAPAVRPLAASQKLGDSSFPVA